MSEVNKSLWTLILSVSAAIIGYAVGIEWVQNAAILFVASRALVVAHLARGESLDG